MKLNQKDDKKIQMNDAHFKMTIKMQEDDNDFRRTLKKVQ